MAGRVSSPRLVGRAQELARLRAAVADAAAGRARLVLVAGDAGIGKSRLVGELLAQPGPGVRALVGGCLAIADEGLPYAPLTEALRGLARDLDEPTLEAVLGPARAELAQLVPDLAAEGAPSGLPAARAAGRAGQARLFELILGLLRRLGGRAPVLLVVEDLHWADEATRDLLVYLVANLRDERTAIVATMRTDEAVGGAPGDPWLVELMRPAKCERVDLRPLTSAEVADQLLQILGSAPSPALVAEIAAQSGGNALFVEELMAARHDDVARGAGDGAAPGAGPPAPLPRSLREMLAARIRDLAPDTAAVVRMLAIAGRAVDDRLLVAATELPAPAVHAAIHDAVTRHLVDIDAAAEVTIGARDVSLDWLGVTPGQPLKLSVEARWTLQSGNVLGVGGMFEVNGKIGFKGCSINDFGATLAFGQTENYFAAKAGATVLVLGIPVDFTAGIFAGRACSLDPLRFIDPEVEEVLIVNATEFTGVYLQFGGGLSLSDILFGGSSCVLDVGAHVNGALYYQGGPRFGSIGGRQKVGVDVDLICIISASADWATALRLDSVGKLTVQGSARLCGKIGACPFCLKACKTLKVTGLVSDGGIDYDIDF